MLRYFFMLACLCIFTACERASELTKSPDPLGDFSLGYSVVVAPHPVAGPMSRPASDDEWIAAVKKALDQRFERYEGDKLYHIAVSVDGFMLAKPGIPVLLSPKSALILNATIWDDAAGVKLNEKPHQIAVIESLTVKTLIGSGLTMSRRAQLENLSRNAALSVERWMTSMMVKKRWFSVVSKRAVRRKQTFYRIKLFVKLVGMPRLRRCKAVSFAKLKLVAKHSCVGSQIL